MYANAVSKKQVPKKKITTIICDIFTVANDNKILI
jgi:hypothetical protein